jgi:hypothetical protein
MANCQACTRPTDLFLCPDCVETLTNMLDQLPWLIDELDTRIQRLDRVGAGTIGRNRRPDELNVMDFDAAETARELRQKLVRWVETVAEKHTGRRPPALNTTTTKNLARWLHANTHAIARLPLAGKLYRDIKTIVGPDQQGGQLVRAINPTENHLVGPCPTITGRDHQGHPRQCGHILFADTYDRTVTCPTCNQDINVERNRTRAAAERDLHTETQLLEVLTNCGEPIDPDTLKEWIKTRRLRPAGRLHNGLIVPTHTHDQEPLVYSIKRARKLRARDGQLRRRTRHYNTES